MSLRSRPSDELRDQARPILAVVFLVAAVFIAMGLQQLSDHPHPERASLAVDPLPPFDRSPTDQPAVSQ